MTKARRLTGIRATKPLTEEDISQLREQWFHKYSDILGGAPPELPPLREVNHRIPLIDEGKRYTYHLLAGAQTLCGNSYQTKFDNTWRLAGGR